MASPCVSVIREAGGDLITEEQAEELVTTILNRMKTTQSAQQVSAEAAMKIVGKELIENNKLHSSVVKRNALLTIKASRVLEDYVKRPVFKTMGEGLDAYLNGTRKLIDGGRLSVDARIVALRSGYVGKLLAGLEDADLLREFKTGELDFDVYKELWNYKSPDYVSDNPKAKAMARIIRELQEEVIPRENRAGAYINMRDNYIMSQTHDAIRIRKAGGMGFKPGSAEASFEAWSKEILPLLDHEATFSGADPVSFLKGVHEGILTGVHGKSGLSAGSEFAGAGSLAKKVSHKRVLHFKDPESFYKYNQMFGANTLRDGVLNDLRRSAHTSVLMESFGPNPEMTFKRLLRGLKEEARSMPNDFQQMKSLESEWLTGSFDQLIGKHDMPNSPTLHSITRAFQAQATLSKLGGVMLSAIPDKAFLHLAGTYQGMKGIDVVLDQFKIFAPRSKEERMMLHSMGAAIDGFLGEVALRFTSMDDTTGRMFRLQQSLFKLNGMNWWNDVHKGGFAKMTSAHLGAHATTAFKTLPADLSKVLKLYGIEDVEWRLLSKVVEEVEGTKYMVPDRIKNLSDESLDKVILNRGEVISEHNRARLRDELETKLRTYITDQVDDAVPTPGNKERLITNLNTPSGTAKGTAARLLMHFKSFPITVFNKVLKREALGHGSFTGMERLFNKGNFRMAQLIALTTIGGYVSMSIKDALRGKTPRRIVNEDGSINIDVINAAALRGGGLGIYGDFLFNEYDRSYKNFLNVAAGPTVGQLSEIAALTSEMKEGKVSAKSAEKLILGNTPYINLFYIRPILDYIILWNIQEMVSPGSLRKAERKIEKENHQGFFIRPSEVAR